MYSYMEHCGDIISVKLKCFLLTLLLCTLALFSPANVKALTCADLNGAYLLSTEDPIVYLGFFGSETAPTSIFNLDGPYGSDTSPTSVRNASGVYGSKNGLYSHNNPNSTAYPFIVKEDFVIGRLNSVDLNGFSLDDADACAPFSATSPNLPEPPLPPDSISASDGLFYDRIMINWGLSEYAKGYNLYASDSPTGSPTFWGSFDAPIVVGTNLPPYTYYYFWVSAYNAYGESSLTGPAEGSTFVEPVKIMNGELYISIEDAYTDASDGAVIMARVDAYPGALEFNLNKDVVLKGGYNFDFTSNDGHVTGVSPLITISNGTVTLENIVIQ